MVASNESEGFIKSLIDSYQQEDSKTENSALKAMRTAFLTIISRNISKRKLQKYLNPHHWEFNSKTLEYQEEEPSESEDSNYLTDDDFDEVAK
jgi:hypothetical protein